MSRLGWPIRRLLDTRFADISQRVWNAREAIVNEVRETRSAVDHVAEGVDRVVGDYAVTSTEALSHVGQELRRLEGSIESMADKLAEDAVQARRREALDELAHGQLPRLDDAGAAVLNYGESHVGYAAQAGLWFNSPISLYHHAGGVEISNVNERIVEVPFAFRALSRLPPGSHVLDFGAAESHIALSLASLGFHVTALDLRPYPLTHPNLTSIASPIESWNGPAGSFDAVLCISTIEHVGLGWYGEPASTDQGGDRDALARCAELLTADGSLVLTVPYGEASCTAVQRTYDAAGLAELMEGWEVMERQIVAEVSPQVWSVGEDSAEHAVAMVVARRAAA